MNPGNVEINFQRLLLKCEQLAENEEYNNWRFEKVRIWNKNLKINNSISINLIFCFKVYKFAWRLLEKIEQNNGQVKSRLWIWILNCSSILAVNY